MEPNGVPTTTFRHRRSPSSDRFLTIFSSSPPPSGGDDELNEDDILWTGDFTDPNHHSISTSTTTTTTTTTTITNHNRSSFLHNSGILAVLPESNHQSVLHRKPLISSSSSSSSTSSSSKLIPSIPRPPQDREYKQCQSVPSRKFQQQSAPMNVPVLSMAMTMAITKQGNSKFNEFDDHVGDDEMLLPPHEIVARGSGMSPKTTFSVLEGVGRTLKGRDLRQVRNAVWRQTGFLD